MRLDKYLVEHGYYESRNRALEAIKSGRVKVDDKVAKPSLKVDDSSNIEIDSQKFYVSRAARKLESFLVEFGVSVEGRVALDIGSSTGGFAQILLEGGVASLDCVDVGRDQLHHSLRSHSCLSLHEETDIRLFESSKQFDLLTCDVSFISILQIIEDIDRLSHHSCDIIILYKPQFEVGRIAKRDSRGVVQDEDAVAACMYEFESRATELGWQSIRKSLSQITGKEGNQEYLYHFKKYQGKYCN